MVKVSSGHHRGQGEARYRCRRTRGTVLARPVVPAEAGESAWSWLLLLGGNLKVVVTKPKAVTILGAPYVPPFLTDGNKMR